MRILIVGLSTRGIAESAVRGGYQVLTLDYFGDYDPKLLVKSFSLRRDFHLSLSQENYLKVFRKISQQADYLVYTSPFENFPGAIETMGKRIQILGNNPETLKKSRDWRLLRSISQEYKFLFPKTIFHGEKIPISGKWLEKPIRGGGGHRIESWKGKHIKNGFFLQEFKGGQPCSVIFLADGKNSIILGFTEQLIGKSEFGAEGFKWCGNIFPLSIGGKDNKKNSFFKKLEKTISNLTKIFGLRGINGIDFIAPEGVEDPVILEINPRFTASVELIEFSLGICAFDLHVNACMGKVLNPFSENRKEQRKFFGKAILYAKSDLNIPSNIDHWFFYKIKDIPFPGEEIKKGHPICSIFSVGENREACYQGLLELAMKIEKQIL